MIKTFKEIEDILLKNNQPKTVVLAGAHDDIALNSIIEAKGKNLVKVILVGIEEEIKKLLVQENENIADYEIINCEDEKETAQIAIKMIREEKADIPMKGLMQTSSFMKAILDKENGLIDENSLLSQCTILEDRQKDQFLFISDCAVNIEPKVEEKIKIIENCNNLAKRLGYNKPKIGIVSAVEVVNPKIISTIEADELTKHFSDNNECLVYGPLALDNALSIEAAKHKGITNEVAGSCDILIMPDLCSGNIFGKLINHYTNLKSAGVLLGTKVPVIMTSRTDSKENKYNAILTSLYLN